MQKKICFVLSSIGEEGTETRILSDEKFELVYEPSCTELG